MAENNPGTGLQNIMPKILGRGLMALRERVTIPSLVNSDYGAMGRQFGDTIDIPLPVAQAAAVVSPATTPSAEVAHIPTKVQIPLDQWYSSHFHLTDKEIREIGTGETFLPIQTSEAIKALANQVNQHIFGKYTAIYGAVGVPGTVPFAGSNGLEETVSARKLLNEQLCPRDQRRAVIDFTAEESALQVAPFRDTSQSTDRGPIVEGELGRKLGFNWYADDHVPLHTTGGESATVVNGTTAAGLSALPFDGGDGVGFNKGDIITIGGAATQQYVVTADHAGTSGTLAISPPLVAEAANDTVIQAPLGTHRVNLCFHRDAFAFVNRPLEIEQGLGNKILAMQDPASGISMRLEVSRQYKQTRWEFDILWGAACIRPELAVRLMG